MARLAITVREVAGPQVSPLPQSESLGAHHLRCRAHADRPGCSVRAGYAGVGRAGRLLAGVGRRQGASIAGSDAGVGGRRCTCYQCAWCARGSGQGAQVGSPDAARVGRWGHAACRQGSEVFVHGFHRTCPRCRRCWCRPDSRSSLGNCRRCTGMSWTAGSPCSGCSPRGVVPCEQVPPLEAVGQSAAVTQVTPLLVEQVSIELVQWHWSAARNVCSPVLAVATVAQGSGARQCTVTEQVPPWAVQSPSLPEVHVPPV